MPPNPSDVGPARHELDGMVAGAELTLISIIQGVALYFLVAEATRMVNARDWAGVPYIASGLFAWDGRLLRLRAREATGRVGKMLFETLSEESAINARLLMPASAVIAAAIAAAAWIEPQRMDRPIVRFGLGMIQATGSMI